MKRYNRIESMLIESFNEQQVIEGDSDLQTNNPNNPLFLEWLKWNSHDSEIEAYKNFREKRGI